MSLRSRLADLFGRQSEKDATEEIPKVEFPRQNERQGGVTLQEQAQAVEIFRAVDAIIAKRLNEALNSAGVKPADKLAKNDKYQAVVARLAGEMNNPIRGAVERYAKRQSQGSEKLMALLTDDKMQEYVTDRLKALALGEPLQYLNVAQLYDAIKKWGDADPITTQPVFDSGSARTAQERIQQRLVPKATRV